MLPSNHPPDPSEPEGGPRLWLDGSPEPLDGSEILAPALEASGERRIFELHYQVSRREWRNDGVGAKSLEAHWCRPNGTTVAYANVSLVFCTKDATPSAEILDCMGSVSQAFYDVGLLLSASAKHPISKLFLYGRHLGFLERIEVRADLRGRGLGLKLAQQLMTILHQHFQTSLLVLNPFPLQFAGRFKDASGDELKALKQAFIAAQQRVSRLYETELPAVALAPHDPHRAVLLDPGLDLHRDRRGWWLGEGGTKLKSAIAPAC